MTLRYIDRDGPTSPPFDGINLKRWRFNEGRLVSLRFLVASILFNFFNL